jgi:anti-sigma factor (TIGR02949 family)
MTANCQSTLTRLAEFLDGVLAPPEAEHLRGHVATCARCTEFLAAYRGIGSIVARATAVDPPDDLTARVLGRLRLGSG